jgi:hypothetical protein
MPRASADPKTTPQQSTEQRHADVVDPRVVDPESGQAWTHFMDGPKVVRYMNTLGIPIALQTLNQRRTRGQRPQWRYAGQKPLTTKDEVDSFIDEEYLTVESPLAGRTGEGSVRAAEQRAQQKAKQQPPEPEMMTHVFAGDALQAEQRTRRREKRGKRT